MKTTIIKYGTGYDLVVTQQNQPKVGSRLTLGIRCHKCQRVSYHPKDIYERYCGACHVFHEDSLLSHEG